MATLRAHNSTEYWKKTDLMVKPASYPIAVGYDVPSVDTIHRPLTLDLSEVSHEIGSTGRCAGHRIFFCPRWRWWRFRLCC